MPEQTHQISHKHEVFVGDDLVATLQFEQWTDDDGKPDHGWFAYLVHPERTVFGETKQELVMYFNGGFRRDAVREEFPDEDAPAPEPLKGKLRTVPCE